MLDFDWTIVDYMTVGDMSSGQVNMLRYQRLFFSAIRIRPGYVGCEVSY